MRFNVNNFRKILEKFVGNLCVVVSCEKLWLFWFIPQLITNIFGGIVWLFCDSEYKSNQSLLLANLWVFIWVKCFVQESWFGWISGNLSRVFHSLGRIFIVRFIYSHRINPAMWFLVMDWRFFGANMCLKCESTSYHALTLSFEHSSITPIHWRLYNRKYY